MIDRKQYERVVEGVEEYLKERRYKYTVDKDYEFAPYPTTFSLSYHHWSHTFELSYSEDKADSDFSHIRISIPRTTAKYIVLDWQNTPSNEFAHIINMLPDFGYVGEPPVYHVVNSEHGTSTDPVELAVRIVEEDLNEIPDLDLV